MHLVRKLTLALVASLLWLDATSYANAEDYKDDSCQMLKYGVQHRGFVGCGPREGYVRLSELVKQGDSEALYVLALIYDEGGAEFGLPNMKPNGDLAEKYYLESAQAGYAEAQARIASIYWREYRDTKQEDALYWWCRAAKQDNYEATVNIRDQIRFKKAGQTVEQFCGPMLKEPLQKQQ